MFSALCAFTTKKLLQLTFILECFLYPCAIFSAHMPVKYVLCHSLDIWIRSCT